MLLILAVSAAAIVTPTAADAASGAGSNGTLIFLPSSGIASSPLTAVSTGVCSDSRGTNLQLEVVGKGFPPGTNVTPNLAARIYPVDPSTGGYDVPLQDTLQHFASQQNPPAVLSGRYDFTLVCKKPWGVGIYNTYRGSLWFTSATHFHSLSVQSAPMPTPDASTRPPAPTTSAARATVPASTRPVTPQPVTTTHLHARSSAAPSPTPAAPKHSSTVPAVRATRAPRTTTAPPHSPQPTRASSSAALTAAASPASAAAATTNRPVAAALPARARNSARGVVAGLLTGSLAVVVLLGLVVRRRLTRTGRR